MRAIIRIFDLKTGQEIEEKRTFISGTPAKLWLGGVVIWCMARGYLLEVFNEADEALADADINVTRG